MSDKKPTPGFIRNMIVMMRNEMASRSAFLRKFLDPRRDYDTECGYLTDISIDNYKERYERGDIAARIVNIYPEECWSADPEVFETDDAELTPFEKEWLALNQKVGVYSTMLQADILAGIGQFGVLLIGFNDNQNLDQPVLELQPDGTFSRGGEALQVLYLRAFDQSVVKVSKFNSDQKSPRYSLPDEYEITFIDPNEVIGAPIDTNKLRQMKVHWSRVIHIADNCTNSRVYGIPRLKKIFDRLLDLRKILGGAGEMFWKGGFPGFSVETNVDPKEGGIEIDLEATKEQLEAYMNTAQRWIATEGLTVKNLGTQVADPRPHVEAQIRVIACAMSIPWRILMGVEVGQLASEQDIRAWNRRLKRRREAFINTHIILPFANRLIATKTLPAPKDSQSVKIWWPDLNTLSDEERANVAEKKTNAAIKYVQGGVSHLIPPFYFFTLVMGFTDEEANAIMDEAGSDLDTLDEVMAKLNPQPGQSATKGAMQPSRRASPTSSPARNGT
jgi:hypothetical protein